MSKRIQYKVLGIGNKCINCEIVMERRGHKEIDDKVLAQPYYFKEWDFCKGCNFVQHFEDMKVWNNNKAAQQLRYYLNAKEERENKLDFLRSI